MLPHSAGIEGFFRMVLISFKFTVSVVLGAITSRLSAENTAAVLDAMVTSSDIYLMLSALPLSVSVVSAPAKLIFTLPACTRLSCI
jgi:hypothetical protein